MFRAVSDSCLRSTDGPQSPIRAYGVDEKLKVGRRMGTRAPGGLCTVVSERRSVAEEQESVGDLCFAILRRKMSSTKLMGMTAVMATDGWLDVWALAFAGLERGNLASNVGD